MAKMILTGDINLMGIRDAESPLAYLAPAFRKADYVYSNLECCLFDPPLDSEGRATQKGYFVSAEMGGEALRLAAVRGVGMANNVTLGRDPILGSISRLDQLGIQHTGAGANLQEARAPIIWEHDGLRVGFLQRTSVYWANGQEAKADAAGVAVVRGLTAYQVPDHKTHPEMTLFNRPGLPPRIVTWVDPPYLQRLQDDIRDLRTQCDIVVMSCHWGWHEEVLDYMPQWAHAAVDAGADIVLGHGPHYVLPVEIYKHAPIFYGLGSLWFRLKGSGEAFGAWLGAVAEIEIDQRRVVGATLRFVRPDAHDQSQWSSAANEAAALQTLVARSEAYGTRLTSDGDAIRITLPDVA